MTNQNLEIASMPLKPGTDLTKGCYAVYHGLQKESPDVVELAIHWESLDAHKAFVTSTSYGPFSAKVGTLMGGPGQFYNLSIPAEYPVSIPLSAPVTESLSLYLDPSHENTAFEAN
ncbi:hypothetical protein CC80DRAFT_593461 [Byssothecium circinans]|uniref:ABM domain-containing protein n=1 Tax=Byssothecium circinans TaxID=147558 RepID=A0A6A5U170_9PLEO|nr:hypothetical protein CC80DRAFT_593461 [Byssothecium circinans]